MAYEAQIRQLREIKAEVSAGIQHAILRLAKVRDEFAEIDAVRCAPLINQLNQQIDNYKVFLN